MQNSVALLIAERNAACLRVFVDRLDGVADLPLVAEQTTERGLETTQNGLYLRDFNCGVAEERLASIWIQYGRYINYRLTLRVKQI